MKFSSEFVSRVAIASTMHEPEQSLLEALTKLSPQLSEQGVYWHISATQASIQKPNGDTQPLYDLISKHFSIRKGEDGVEANHFSAFKQALEADKPFILYFDSDRLTMGLSYFRNPTILYLEKALQSMGSEHIEVLTRSSADMNTHHAPLVLTETVINNFWSKHLGQNVDVGSTAYMISSEVVAHTVDAYERGDLDEFSCTFPHPKIISFSSISRGIPLVFTQTHNMLRYEAPEQFRGAGRINVFPHEWTPFCYEQITLASRPIQEELSTNPNEWRLRLTTMKQYLNLLETMFLIPRGIIDNDLEVVVEKTISLLPEQNANYYRQQAIDIAKKYA